MPWIPLIAFGLGAGLISGLLGIGGGTVLVPVLLMLGYSPLQAVATSSLAIIVTASSGTVQNWRMGFVDLERVALLGLPALVFAQAGVQLADVLPERWLLVAFGSLMLLNIYLLSLRRRLKTSLFKGPRLRPTPARIVTGTVAGAIAGLLGVGGGAIMVPLQMLLLREPIKRAIQTSLGVIVLTALSSTLGHGLKGNVLWLPGLVLGLGGLAGAQLSTRLLPKLPDRWVSWIFRGFLLLAAGYSFWQAARPLEA